MVLHIIKLKYTVKRRKCSSAAPSVKVDLSVKDSRVLIGRWLGTASTDSKHTRIRFLDLGKRQG